MIRRQTCPSRIALILLVGGALALCCAGFAQDPEGPVAHYTFDEGEGDVAVDHSGNGLDGTISGASFVPSPRGHALRFDGVDDYVDLGRPEGLMLEGDLTIEVWMRPDAVDGRNRMIFGDAAGLSVNRNYNIRLDRKRLFFEHGTGTSHETFIPQAPIEAGKWYHVVLICEYPRYYVYLNGTRVAMGPSSSPITPTQGASRRIGSWFAGSFKGDIDEVRLYNRSLSDAEVSDHFDGSAQVPPTWTELTRRFSFTRHTLACDLFCGGIQGPAPEVEFTVTREGAEAPVLQRTIPLRALRPNSGRWTATLRFSTDELEDGAHAITATVRGKDGTALATESTRFPYSSEGPPWLHSREGITDEVLPPFTALMVDRTQNTLTVKPWGREYQFGSGPFLDGIVSQGRPMLAAPVRLLLTVDGEEVAFEGDAMRLEGQGPATCTLSGRFRAGTLRLQVNTVVECDGLIKLTWRLETSRPVRVDSLAFEIPLHADRAKYLYMWPRVYSSTLGAEHAAPFQPMVWLGDDERGLSWVCETDENWHPADAQKAIQVTKAGDQALLRLDLIGKPTPLAPGEALDYTFGLHATPVKPMDKDAWDYRIVRHPWYGQSFSLPEKTVDGEPALQHFADKGARVLINWRWWDVFAHVAPIGHEDEFRALVKYCHQFGLKMIPYVGGFLLSERAPEALFFMDDMRKTPPELFPLRMPGLPSQNGYITCQRSCWQEFLVDGIARLIDDYDVDGVYLDTTTRPYACTNELHGCGYVRPDGTRAPTYPVFDVRETFKRIYTVVKQRKPDGIVDVHTYDCMNSPALSFATSYWNGEQLPRGRAIKTDALPLARFRTEFMGRNWGVPADLLYYVIGNYQASCGLALLHDVPVRAERLPDLDVEASLWDLRERFGVKQARRLPYWSNQDVAGIEPEGCYVSLWAHPAGRVLAVVTNLTGDDQTVRVKLNLAALGLDGPVTGRDPLADTPVTVDDGAMSLALPSQGWKTVWLEKVAE